MSYDAEVERWKKYLKHIEETRDAIKTYSGSVTAAQTKAQQAIDKWKKGEAATKQAVTDYNKAVDNYNEHLCDPIPVNGPPVIRPAHPGVFVDPGQSIRDEAEEILDGAREDLESAGDDAVGKLQNVDGAKTDAQYDFWGVDADFDGPSVKWPWSKETEDDLEFGDKPGESPWEFSLGSGSLSAWIFNSDASWEDHYGPLGANAEYSALVGVKGDYSAKIDDTGGHAGGELFGGAKLTGERGRRPGPPRRQRRRRGLGRRRHRRRPGLRLGQGQDHRRRPRWHRLGPRWQGRWRLHRRRTRAARHRRRRHLIHRRIPLVNATLPIPVQFELPGPDWAPVDPAASGIENAAFVAARTPITPGYTPTLVISGDERYDDASLRDIAEEAAALLTRETPHLKLLHREEVGSEKAPAITQLIGAGIEVDGQRLDLVQLQVLTAILDVDDPRKRVVVIYKVTCLAPDWPRIGREFQDFMRTVRPAPDQPAVGLLDLPERERDREADQHHHDDQDRHPEPDLRVQGHVLLEPLLLRRGLDQPAALLGAERVVDDLLDPGPLADRDGLLEAELVLPPDEALDASRPAAGSRPPTRACGCRR